VGYPGAELNPVKAGILIVDRCYDDRGEAWPWGFSLRVGCSQDETRGPLLGVGCKFGARPEMSLSSN